MSIRTDTGLVPQQITNDTKTIRLIGMVSNRPSSRQWITIEEHRRRLQEQRSCLVKTESFPETGVDGFCCGDTVSGKVAVVGCCVQTGTWSTNVAWTWSDEGVLAGCGDELRLCVEFVVQGVIRCSWELGEGSYRCNA